MKNFKLIALLGISIFVLSACTANPGATQGAATVTAPTPTQFEVFVPAEDFCVTCHTNKQMLIDNASANLDQSQVESVFVGLTNKTESMEAWEKVFVDPTFFESEHGQASCKTCHGGDSTSQDKETAHININKKPDQNPQKTCGNCHQDIVVSFANSLHSTQNGFYQAMYTRSIPENHPALEEAFTENCASCHTTCGDCHISQPNAIGGGLLNGHNVVKTPPMTQTCTACHGSRVGNEFLGKNDGLVADIHSSQFKMECTACHTGQSLHDSSGANHRYEGEQSPACIDCHQKFGRVNDVVPEHQIHQDKLSCQTCHTIAYTSCDGCHLSNNENTGQSSFTMADTTTTFYIGKNVRQSADRPYEYTVVRHIPVTPDTFAAYGDNLLPNFDLLPTWAYATPHNIQRMTPQSRTCNSCHGNAEIFLTADKVKPEELEANKNVIVDQIPAMVPTDK